MQQRISFTTVLLLAVLLLFPVAQTGAAERSRITGAILDSAESFFLSLRDLDFKTAWSILSSRSRQSIINDVYETSVKIGGTLRKEDIIRDFERQGIIFTNYWKSFLRSFDTDIVLEQSLWQMGDIEETEAEIIIQYDEFSNPTVLRMFKENNTWKVGIEETFSKGTLEKWLDYLRLMHGV